MTPTELFHNRERLFWILNIAGWTGYAFTAYLGALVHDKPGGYTEYVAAIALVGFLLTVPMRFLYRRLWSKPPAAILVGILGTSYGLALGWVTYKNILYVRWLKSDWQLENFTDYISGVMYSFYVLLCWSGLYFGIKFYQQSQEQTKRALAATATAHQAQLKMLRYQLNPHFLFNTLNAISTLILDRSNETANLAVSRLSDFLRYTLDNDPMRRVTLGSELSAIDLYLEIEKVRFGDRLIVEKEVENEAMNALVPSLILQPLIENAIKYAISPSEEGGTLRISAKVRNNMLLLKLTDDGPGLSNGGKPSSKSGGVGLQNTRERLQQFYGDSQALTLAPNEPTGLLITINIPFETEQND